VCGKLDCPFDGGITGLHPPSLAGPLPGQRLCREPKHRSHRSKAVFGNCRRREDGAHLTIRIFQSLFIVIRRIEQGEYEQ
jgi:hypothetical protein